MIIGLPRVTVADAFVAAFVVAVVVWVVFFAGCRPPPLPAEGPITVTISTRDAGR